MVDYIAHVSSRHKSCLPRLLEVWSYLRDSVMQDASHDIWNVFIFRQATDFGEKTGEQPVYKMRWPILKVTSLIGCECREQSRKTEICCEVFDGDLNGLWRKTGLV